jgi:hypothetical protein
MSNLRELAKLIPDEYRREILQLNMITNAKGSASDPNMHYLATIWKNYIEPGFSPDCGLCYGRVLENMKHLQPVLIELEQESKLLKSA